MGCFFDVCVCVQILEEVWVLLYRKKGERETEAVKRRALGGWSSRAPLALGGHVTLSPGSVVSPCRSTDTSSLEATFWMASRRLS